MTNGERSSKLEARSSNSEFGFRISDFFRHSSFVLRHSVIFLAIWLSLLVFDRSRMFQDPGSFWHVAVGEKTLAAGRVLREDPFSFTRAGRPWVDHQWLANCGMAAVHRANGLGRAAVGGGDPVSGHLRMDRRAAGAQRPALSARRAAAGRDDIDRSAAVSRPTRRADDRPAGRQLCVAGRRGSRRQTAAATVVARALVCSLDEPARRRAGAAWEPPGCASEDGALWPLSRGERTTLQIAVGQRPPDRRR